MARTKKIATDEERKRAQDKRLQREYGITLAERDEIAQRQDNKCLICSGPLTPPCVDHFHFRVEVINAIDPTTQVIVGWTAYSLDEQGKIVYLYTSPTKKHAIAEVKKLTMPWAIRGLLCRHCNRALGMLERWFDAARGLNKVQASLDYLSGRLRKA